MTVIMIVIVVVMTLIVAMRFFRRPLPCRRCHTAAETQPLSVLLLDWQVDNILGILILRMVYFVRATE